MNILQYVSMYFIEILSKTIKKIKNRKSVPKDLVQADENTEPCKHVFVPIDSTGKVFACMNCGLVIKDKPQNINFFEENK